MVTLAGTVLILVAVYLLQQTYPILAGILAVTPVKIVATSLMIFEEGGIPPLQEAIGGMILGQLLWTAALVAVWCILR
jgi:hypothetical protein